MLVPPLLQVVPQLAADRAHSRARLLQLSCSTVYLAALCACPQCAMKHVCALDAMSNDCEASVLSWPVLACLVAVPHSLHQGPWCLACLPSLHAPKTRQACSRAPMPHALDALTPCFVLACGPCKLLRTAPCLLCCPCMYVTLAVHRACPHAPVPAHLVGRGPDHCAIVLHASSSLSCSLVA